MHTPIQSSYGRKQLLQIARTAIRTHFNLEAKKNIIINERDVKNNSRLLIIAIYCRANQAMSLPLFARCPLAGIFSWRLRDCSDERSLQNPSLSPRYDALLAPNRS